ncbi:hypothetical protein JTB14_025411 [Gonioctena quinquepunctata]|nr:hypothetical protein JTB14_025411 [Gonioctena quinquepunctata]
MPNNNEQKECDGGSDTSDSESRRSECSETSEVPQQSPQKRKSIQTSKNEDLNKFGVMRRNGVEDHKESKFSPTDLREYTDFNGLAKPKVNHFNDGGIVKTENEDHSEYIDLLMNNAGLKRETLKSEYHIDVIYEDVKPAICEEKADLLIQTEIGPNFSHEFSKDLETAVERDNDTKKDSTMRNNSENSQMIQKLPYCKYLKFKCKVCSKNFVAKNTLKEKCE